MHYDQRIRISLTRELFTTSYKGAMVYQSGTEKGLDHRNRMNATRALSDLVYGSYKCFKKCSATYYAPCKPRRYYLFAAVLRDFRPTFAETNRFFAFLANFYRLWVIFTHITDARRDRLG
jgi:hypothetical protein